MPRYPTRLLSPVRPLQPRLAVTVKTASRSRNPSRLMEQVDLSLGLGFRAYRVYRV